MQLKVAAIWLVMEQELSWVEALPAAWWQRWAWYILRELHPHMTGEPNEPKVLLLRELHERAPGTVKQSLEDLASSTGPDTQYLLKSLLDLMVSVDDSELDERLCARLESGEVPDDRMGDVAQFVLSRSCPRALPACLSRIEPQAVEKAEGAAIRAAVTLLEQRSLESWDRVFQLLRLRPDLAPRILGPFSHEGLWRSRQEDDLSKRARLSCGQAGQLALLLLEAFPPETDPKYVGKVHPATPDDSARRMRDHLISWLGDQRDIEAVEALRMLEERFGTKYTWLRRPRARAERSYRLSRWVPIPPRSVAELLAANDKCFDPIQSRRSGRRCGRDRAVRKSSAARQPK